MCGIAGIAYNNGQPVEYDILENMTRSMKHRGPDDEGKYISKIPNPKSLAGKTQMYKLDWAIEGSAL